MNRVSGIFSYAFLAFAVIAGVAAWVVMGTSLFSASHEDKVLSVVIIGAIVIIGGMNDRLRKLEARLAQAESRHAERTQDLHDMILRHSKI